MTYQQTCDYLFSQIANYEHQGKDGYKEGLQNSLDLDAHFGHPHRFYHCIHVAGTNGKGSVSHLLAAVLQAQGFRVGLYTSPHLISFTERIRVNGKPISEDDVVRFVEDNRPFFEPLHPSFFELATAMAFRYFKEQKVDIAVIEVGLGGRLDCTNIITPVLSIITNIALEHTQMLGNTITQIAREKGGIIKSHTPAVVGETVAESRSVFCSLAEQNASPIIFAEDLHEIAVTETTSEGWLRYHTRHFGTFDCELTGNYQPKNMATVESVEGSVSVRNVTTVCTSCSRRLMMSPLW